MKITSYASKSITDLSTIEFRQHFFLSSSISTADFLNRILVSIPFYHRPHTDQISTADFFEIKRNLRQHSFLSSVHTGQFFQQLIFFDQMRAPPASLSIIGSYRSIFSTAGLFRSNENSVSIFFYHRFIQAKF